MYQWRINMVDGKSYVIMSSINNSIDIINELFGVKTNPPATVSVTHYELDEPKDEFNRVAIVSSHIVSVEWIS